MVEVTVEDVIVRSPKAEPAVWIAEATASTPHSWRVVLLREQAVAEGRAEPDPVEKERRSFQSLPRNEAWLHPRAGRGVAEGAR